MPIDKEKAIGALSYINRHRGKLCWFRINTKVDKQMKTIKHSLITSCLGILLLSAYSTQGAGPLPEFTFKGVALHPDGLSWAPTGELEHPDMERPLSIVFFSIFVPLFFLSLMAWAASTMNQSDIRGLSLRDRADIDILRRKLCVLQS